MSPLLKTLRSAPAWRRLWCWSWVGVIAGVGVTARAEISAQWTLPGIGDWYDAANWTNGIIPVANSPEPFRVTIQSGAGNSTYVQASLNGNMTISRLTLSEVLYVYDSTLTTRRQFQVQDECHWLGGELSGWSTDYHLFGNTILAGPTVKTLDRRCTLTLHDQATWLAGTLNWQGYGSVTIAPNARFTLATGGTIGSAANTSSASVTNAGTIHLNAPGATAKFYGSVLNEGQLELEAGQLQFNSTFINRGNIHIATGARLIIGSVWGAATWYPFAFTGGGGMDWLGSQQLPVDLTVPCAVYLAGGISGPGHLTVSNAIWAGAAVAGPGALIVPPGGSLVITNPTAQLGTRLQNGGDLFLAPNARLMNLSSGGQLTNTASGVLHVAGGARVDAIPTANFGALRKDDGSQGAATWNSWLDNSGVVLTTAGQLNLLGGGTNRGTLTAESAGAIYAEGLDLGDTSQLTGSGLVALGGGSLRGTVSSNLAVSLSGTRSYAQHDYQFKTLEVANTIGFATNYGAEVMTALALRGGLDRGTLRSRAHTELAFNTATLSGGAQLELEGQATWLQGTLTVQQSNTLFLNRSALRVQGLTSLRVQSGAAFVNQAQCTFSAQIGTVAAGLSDSVFQWTTANLTGTTTLADGPWQLSGPVTLMPQILTAGPGARVVFDTFGVMNAQLHLVESSLETTTGLSGSNIVLRLDRSSVTGPPKPWLGQVTLSGNGSVVAQLTGRTLELAAVPGSNALSLTGPLAFPANGICRIRPIFTNDVPVFPHLAVQGPVTLAGNFELVVPFGPSGSNWLAGPIPLVTAAQPILGSFANAASGSSVTLTNGFRGRLYYGPDSPYGGNQLVLVALGSAFDQWRLERFTPAELADPNLSGAGADPDLNGFNLLAEFALALDLSPGSNALPVVRLGPDGYPRIQLRQRKDLGHLQVTLGVSTNLQTWLTLPVGQSAPGLSVHRIYDLGAALEYQYRYLGTSERCFLRLMITAPP